MTLLGELFCSHLCPHLILPHSSGRTPFSVLDFSVYDTPLRIVLFASVSTPVDSLSVRAAFLWIFLSTPIIWIFCLKLWSSFAARSPASLFAAARSPASLFAAARSLASLFAAARSQASLFAAARSPTSLFATRSRLLASRLFECCDENSVSVLDCLFIYRQFQILKSIFLCRYSLNNRPRYFI